MIRRTYIISILIIGLIFQSILFIATAMTIFSFWMLFRLICQCGIFNKNGYWWPFTELEMNIETTIKNFIKI